MLSKRLVFSRSNGSTILRRRKGAIISCSTSNLVPRGDQHHIAIVKTSQIRLNHVRSTPICLCTSAASSPLHIPSPSSSSSSGSVDLGELDTAPASGINIFDLVGPWLVMSRDLQGELHIHADGFVTLTMPTAQDEGEVSLDDGGESSTATAKARGGQPKVLANAIGRIRVIEEPLLNADSDNNSTTNNIPPPSSNNNTSTDDAASKVKISLNPAAPKSVSLFSIDMEIYSYDRASPNHPPMAPRRVVLTGVISKAASEKAAYRTLTLSGNADRVPIGEGRGGGWDDAHVTTSGGENELFSSSSSSNNLPFEDAASDFEIDEGIFYAAKLLPWGEADNERRAQTVWAPKKDVHYSFSGIFGHLPLNVTSHISRAVGRTMADMEAKLKSEGGEEHRAAAESSPPAFAKDNLDVAEDAASSNIIGTKHEGPPYHMNLAPYSVGASADISGIYYIPNYISEAEHAQFMQHLAATPSGLKAKLKKRTCQEWGGTMCTTCHKSFLPDGAIPPWAQKVNEMLLFDGIFTPTTFPNSVRIHEYEQREGIGPHCDGPIYVPRVAVLSLASTSVMHFYPRRDPYGGDKITDHYSDTFKFGEGEIGSQTPLASIVLEPNSLLLFTGEAFTHYPHGLTDKAVEELGEGSGLNVVNRHLLADPTITTVERRYRASVTVRHLLPRCGHEATRGEVLMKEAWHHYNQLPAPRVTRWDETPTVLNMNKNVKDARSSNKKKEAGHTWNLKNDLNSFTSYCGDKSSSANLCTTPFNLLGNDSEKIIAAVADIAASQVRLAKDVADIKYSLEELKTVIAFSTTSTANFQKETSSILNTLSVALMEVSSRQEDVAEEMTSIKDALSGSGAE